MGIMTLVSIQISNSPEFLMYKFFAFLMGQKVVILTDFEDKEHKVMGRVIDEILYLFPKGSVPYRLLPDGSVKQFPFINIKSWRYA